MPQNEEVSEGPKCVQCSVDESGVYRLQKCPVCFRSVCERCAIRNYGRAFCSKQCAMNFFLYEE